METLALPLGDGWVLCQQDIDRLAVLNTTGKLVWDLLESGFGPQEIASFFAKHYGLPAEGASTTIGSVIGGLEEAGFLARPPGDAGAQAPSLLTNSDAVREGPQVYCGTFQFGACNVQIHSTLPDIGEAYLSRFRHQASEGEANADVLSFSRGPSNYRLTYQGEVVAEESSLAELVGRAHELFLSWEHPKTEFLAYFHAAAVSLGDKSVLIPGVSSTGKSTLTAYLAARGFTYLGDDSIAMARGDWSLRPLPTCLSLKSGSWPILTALYPEIPHLPIVRFNGRDMRYVEPREPRHAGRAPSLILFPTRAERGMGLRRLDPLETMTQLIETSADLHRPATGAALAEFLKFVEQTPAYELLYPDLHSAKTMIEDELARTA